MPSPLLFTRRNFLRTAAVASALTVMPKFLEQAAAAQQVPADRDAPILVVVQLGGGNDGLNCVVPFANDAYHRARGPLALAKKDVLRLNDDLALNPGMEALKGIYDDGGLGIINGVGYPNPNRSHFRSMEIWHTATDSHRYSRTGWLGRYFDNCCAGAADSPLAGIAVGAERPQAFDSRKGHGVAFRDPDRFRWLEGKAGDSNEAFQALNRLQNPSGSGSEALDFLRHTTASAVVSSDRVRRAGQSKRPTVDYPNGQLAQSLRHIATMIAGGLPTRIYYASMSGFDTHANQEGQHENLLRQFSEAVAAFQRDLRGIGAADRVTTLCFSEFGRRVEVNGSRGTDHGTAGPMFLLGAAAKPGIHGAYPDLEDLDEGDLRHTVDFRAVYAELLQDWMGADPTKVLGKRWEKVGVV